MRTLTLPFLGAAALLAAMTAFGGVQATSILHHPFDADNNEWNVESTNGSAAEVIKTAGDFKTGTGALKVKYTLEKGQFSALSLTIPDGKLAKMEQVQFWLRTDRDTVFVVSLYEKEGGHYNAAFWCPKNVWQQIELYPSDFLLGTEGNDPKDPNNKLDTDRIEKIVLLDMGNLFVQAENPENAIFKVEGGARNFWIDDFQIRSGLPPAALREGEKGVAVDDFQRDFLIWLPVGAGAPTITLDKSGKPLEKRALRAEYTSEPGKFSAVMRPTGKNLSGNKTLAFDIASDKSTKLLIMLEEKNGGRYNAMIEVEGEKKALKKNVKFDDFTLADDSPPDTNGKLDLDSLKLVGFLDLSFLDTQEKRTNTLWVANLRAMP